MKKLLLAIGSAAAVITPVVTVVACGDKINVTIPRPTSAYLASTLSGVHLKDANLHKFGDKTIVFITTPGTTALTKEDSVGKVPTGKKEQYWDLLKAFPLLKPTFDDTNIVGIKEKEGEWKFYVIGLIKVNGTITKIVAEGKELA